MCKFSEKACLSSKPLTTYGQLQTQLDKKHQQLVQQEKTISVLQQDVIHKQHHIESLDELLIESREVRLAFDFL